MDSGGRSVHALIARDNLYEGTLVQESAMLSLSADAERISGLKPLGFLFACSGQSALSALHGVAVCKQREPLYTMGDPCLQRGTLARKGGPSPTNESHDNVAALAAPAAARRLGEHA
jgi:hypothetical protein